jgi:predicted DNA-binding protein (MmcQ/YjbR family)
MAYEWIGEYCLKKPGASSDFKPEWGAVRYFVGGKMFALLGEAKNGEPIFTMKLKPENAVLLREKYEKILPGYYMNKAHWNSLYLDGDVPDETVRAMIDEAHALVLASLAKRVREEILAGAALRE